MNKFIFIVIILTSLFILSCESSTESNDLENKLYIHVKDTNDDYIENVGLHFYVDLNPDYRKNLSTFRYSIGVKVDSIILPLEYNLYQNYPNPFNPQTTIMFSLPITGHTILKILDRADSSSVKVLIDQNLPAGMHAVIWDGKNENDEYVTNNIYLYKLVIEEFEQVKEMFLNMVDSEHIKSLNCIPLEFSDIEGKIEFDYSDFPIAKEVLKIDENGNELGVFTIPDSLHLVLVKEGFVPKVETVNINLSKPIELTLVLENEQVYINNPEIEDNNFWTNLK